MVTINVRRLDGDVVACLKRRSSLNIRCLEGEALRSPAQRLRHHIGVD